MNTPVPAGLCAHCVFARSVVSGRGSQFTMCERARFDDRYARYPALPVLVCPGFERILDERKDAPR